MAEICLPSGFQSPEIHINISALQTQLSFAELLEKIELATNLQYGDVDFAFNQFTLILAQNVYSS